MEQQSIRLTIPESWDEVTIGQFQEIASLRNEGSEKTLDILSILTNEDPDIIRKFDIKTLTEILSLLTWTNQMPNDANYKPILRFDDKEYGMLSKLESLSVGEWIDLEHYLQLGAIENIHFIMSILYRPLITAFNDRDRLLEEYDANAMQRQAELFKDKIMISEVYGTLVFFSLIAKEYIKVMKDYLEEQVMMEMMNLEKPKMKKRSVFNWRKKKTIEYQDGIGTNLSTFLQKETLQK